MAAGKGRRRKRRPRGGVQGLIEALRALRAFEMNTEALDCLEDCARLLQAVNRSEDAVGVFAAAAAGRELLVLPRSARRETKGRRASRRRARRLERSHSMRRGRRAPDGRWTRRWPTHRRRRTIRPSRRDGAASRPRPD